MPAVNWPSEASFSVCTRRSCAVRKFLQRFGQFAGTGLHIFKQACILDCQNGLRRKSLDQIDRVLRERAGRATADHQQTDDVVPAEKRRRQPRAITARAG